MTTPSVSKAAKRPNRIDLRTPQAFHTQGIRVDSIKVGKRMRPLGDIDALVGSFASWGC